MEMFLVTSSSCTCALQRRMSWGLTLKRTLLVESEFVIDFSEGEVRPTKVVPWLLAIVPLVLYMADVDSRECVGPGSEMGAAGGGGPPSARLVCFSLQPEQICTMPKNDIL